MIVRLWRGRARPGSADAYQQHVTTAVFPRLQQIEGYLGARVLRREVAGRTEFLVMTEWQSWDAIRAFTGGTPDVAVVEPEARAVLDDFDTYVEHFELAYDQRSR